MPKVSLNEKNRDKGRLHTTGKLYRGCVQQATSKVYLGSIPSNYETVINKVDSVKSFGTSQARFSSVNKSNPIPGPGSYFD